MNRLAEVRTVSCQRGSFLACLAAFGPLIALTDASIAHADLVLGAASNYNEFVLGNSTRSNVDAQGQVAVGGNASFTNFAVASQEPTNTTNLVVGGSLTAQSASMRGNVVTGGNANYTTPTVQGNFSSNGNLTLGGGGGVSGNVRYGTTFNQNGSTVGGSVTGGVSTPLPVNFAAEGAFLLSLSAAQVNPLDPSPSFAFGQMFLTGASGANFFNVTGAQIAGAAGGFNINAPAGATVVINVSGTGFVIPNTGFNLSGGITVDHLLWNFYNATSLTLLGSERGSFLAPQATITTGFGGFNGNLIAGALAGSIETHLFDGGGTGGASTLFDGVVRAVPEANSWLFMSAVVMTLVLGQCGWCWRRGWSSTTRSFGSVER